MCDSLLYSYNDVMLQEKTKCMLPKGHLFIFVELKCKEPNYIPLTGDLN